MRDGWEIKKLGEVCDVLNGFAFDSKLFTEDTSMMPLIRIRDIKKGYTETYYNGAYSNEYIIKNGDYIIGMDGEFNIAEWQGKDSLLNQRVCKLSIKSKALLERFVLWYMPKQLKAIENETSFVTVKHLSSRKLSEVNISVPPISEQERIVKELDLLSGIIEKKRQQLKELDNLAQSIFYDMFGDPITNEKGWEVLAISNVCSSIVRGPFGSALKKDFFVEPSNDTYKVYEQKHAIQKNATIGTYYINSEMYKTLSRFEVKNGDIIMSCSGTIGEFYEIPDGAERGIINQALLKFTLNSLIHKLYFLYTMEWVKENFEKKGSGLQNIGSVKTIKDTSISIPPLSLQQQLAEKVEAIEKQKAMLKQSIEEAETLFNSRMDYYFN